MENINELENKNIIILTKNKIFIFKKENENYIIKEEYPIKKDWKIAPEYYKHFEGDGFFQYYSTAILKNNKLLLNIKFFFNRDRTYRLWFTPSRRTLILKNIFY